MNFIIKIFINSLLCTLLFNCSESKKYEDPHIGECSYELSGHGSKDTINLTYDGKKQGLWIVRKPVISNHLIKKGDNRDSLEKKVVYRILETGFYKDNKKTGYWKYYEKEHGTLIDSVLFHEGVEVKNQ